MNNISGQRVVVIGGGQAGSEVIAALTKRGPKYAISLVAEEAHLPYQRPPLSKSYLNGEMTEERLLIRPLSFYDAAGVTMRLETQAEWIDRAARILYCSEGVAIPYDRLVIATGARVRRLTVPGSDFDNVYYLRSLRDAQRIRAALVPGHRLGIIGGGYVGLELAATAAKAGLHVIVLEAGSRLLRRVASPAVAAFVSETQQQYGVEIRTDCSAFGLEGKRLVNSILCSDGSTISVDLVAVGIGVIPNDELAIDAGLETQTGIVVDELTRTSDPLILAVGDCAVQRDRWNGQLIRIQSVQNAVDTAQRAARSLSGQTLSQTAVPWFWSDQFTLKLQMAGLPRGYDDAVLRLGTRPNAFSEWYFEQGRLVAMAAVNQPQDFQNARRALASGPLAISRADLADFAVPLQPLLEEALQKNSLYCRG